VVLNLSIDANDEISNNGIGKSRIPHNYGQFCNNRFTVPGKKLPGTIKPAAEKQRVDQGMVGCKP
jgi:hypothetical protein